MPTAKVETAKALSPSQEPAKDPATNNPGSSGTPIDYPKSRISLVERSVDEPRTLRVAVIGGGIAGILAGILLPAKVPRIDLVIYEKSRDVVSWHDQTTNVTSNRSREVHGSRMYTQECDVISLLTCINPHLPRILNGPNNLPLAPRSGSTGRVLLVGIMFMTDLG